LTSISVIEHMLHAMSEEKNSRPSRKKKRKLVVKK
jgi:hypothetical protein